MHSDDASPGSSELLQPEHHLRITSRAKTDAVLRLLNGESVESISQELGVTVGRIERWKSSFVAAGAAELSRRRAATSKNSGPKNWAATRQWSLLLIAQVAVISLLVVLMERTT